MRQIAAILAVWAAALAGQAHGQSVWEGVYTNEQADRGKVVYDQSCGSCHGAVLSGGETAPPLAGGEFLSSWNGLTAGDLVERIRTTMPFETPGSLSRESVTNVVTFIFRFNGFPAGPKELDKRAEMQKQIRIEPAPAKGDLKNPPSPWNLFTPRALYASSYQPLHIRSEKTLSARRCALRWYSCPGAGAWSCCL